MQRVCKEKAKEAAGSDAGRLERTGQERAEQGTGRKRRGEGTKAAPVKINQPSPVQPNQVQFSLPSDCASPAKEYSLEYSLAVGFGLGGEGRTGRMQWRAVATGESVTHSEKVAKIMSTIQEYKNISLAYIAGKKRDRLVKQKEGRTHSASGPFSANNMFGAFP